jgi:LPS sulfotransferase NodH
VETSVRVGSYLICATPRSGSTLLCGLLRSTGAAGRPESYFRRPDEQAWADQWHLPRNAAGHFDYRDYVRAARAQGTTPNGIFGARVMWPTVEDIVARLRAARPEPSGTDHDVLSDAFGPVRYVHLRRTDTVAQAVSWARAEQTGYWHPGDGFPASAPEPQFDFREIRSFVEQIDAHTAAWTRWFATAGVRPHVVRYEELVADMTGVTREILRCLGIESPADQIISAGAQRQADELNRDWISRYRAIAPDAAMR